MLFNDLLSFLMVFGVCLFGFVLALSVALLGDHEKCNAGDQTSCHPNDAEELEQGMLQLICCKTYLAQPICQL